MGPAGLAALAITIAVATAAGTALARVYALRRRMLDLPGERRSHQVATPRGGGIAIALALGAALLAAVVLGGVTPLVGAGALLALALVAGIGWIDDHRPLPAWHRLAVHSVSAALVALVAAQVGIPGAACVLAAAGTLVLVNAWNFMDGIDGLAASQGALFGLGCAVLAGTGAPTAIAGLALAAACLGFLPFNLPRARIFLGDVGSGALGLLCALLAVRAMADGVPAAVLTLPLSPFLVDTALTLAGRMLRRERWWAPHVTHAYQCAARRYGHGRVTLGYAGWSLAGLLVAKGVSWHGTPPFTSMMAVVAVWHLLGAGVWWRLRAVDGRPT